jgi:hypothetical protein
MADYFLVHDQAVLDGQLRPALAKAWRQRSFGPCTALCRASITAAREYASRYHIDLDETVLLHVAELPFDRALWRTLTGELLLFRAVELPDLPLPAATLSCLLSLDHSPDRPTSRRRFQSIHQALYGSRDLTFGPVVYRPDCAGLNEPEDVTQLAAALGAAQLLTWNPADLAPLGDLDEADRAEELELAREWFAALVDLYMQTASRGHSLVLEQLF